jgi:hypothetical protein
LSCFIDESGLTDYQPHSPYYLVSLVFHEQDKPINEQLDKLNEVLKHKSLEQDFIHTRPLVRHADPYEDMSLTDRRYLFSQLFLFSKKCAISYRTLRFDRKECRTLPELDKRIAAELRILLLEKLEYLGKFEQVIVYYDDGQKHLSKVVTDEFSSHLQNLDRRHIDPADYRKYRLAQVADMACCIELTAARFKDNIAGRNELAFFESERGFKKSYLKPLRKKLL